MGCPCPLYLYTCTAYKYGCIQTSCLHVWVHPLAPATGIFSLPACMQTASGGAPVQCCYSLQPAGLSAPFASPPQPPPPKPGPPHSCPHSAWQHRSFKYHSSFMYDCSINASGSSAQCVLPSTVLRFTTTADWNSLVGHSGSAFYLIVVCNTE